MNRILPAAQASSAPRFLALGEAVLDRFSRTLHIDGRAQQLEPRLAGVLECLIVNPGLPVTRDALLDTVWGEDASDEALTQTVSRLRRILGQHANISTLPRIGYSLVTEPRPVDGPGPVDKADRPAPIAMAQPTRMWTGMAIGALGTALIGLVVFFSVFGLERREEIEIVTHDPADVASLSDR